MLALLRASQRCRRPAHTATHASRSVPAQRALHATPVALKKKKKAAANDDLFSEDAFADSAEDDLFSTAAPADAAAPLFDSNTHTADGRLTPAARLARFTALRTLVEEHSGTHPAARRARRPEQVRNSAWAHLFGLATSAEQLKEVVEMIPRWRDAKRGFTPRMAEALVRRCTELAAAPLALHVFAHRTKYGVDLPSLSAARTLLRALAPESLDASATLAALLPAYGLPAASQDPLACALLAAACLRADTPEAGEAARELVGALREALGGEVTVKGREGVWLGEALETVEGALRERGELCEWVGEWRARNPVAV